MREPAQLFDRRALIAKRERAARNFDRHDFLVRRSADDVLDRLDLIQRRFPRAIEAGARNGLFQALLHDHAAAEKIDDLIQLEFSPSMAAANAACKGLIHPDELPVTGACCDLVVSLLNLHNVTDLPGTLIQYRQALSPDGLFIGTLFGGETLGELRHSIATAEIEVEQGMSPRIHPMADIRDLGGLLQRAGFALPVADSDKFTVHYDNPVSLMHELRAMGETNALVERRKTFTRRRTLLRACEIYQETFGRDDGRIPATFEIITITGWAPHPSQQKPLKPGSGQISLTQVLERKDGD